MAVALLRQIWGVASGQTSTGVVRVKDVFVGCLLVWHASIPAQMQMSVCLVKRLDIWARSLHIALGARLYDVS